MKKITIILLIIINVLIGFYLFNKIKLIQIKNEPLIQEITKTTNSFEQKKELPTQNTVTTDFSKQIKSLTENPVFNFEDFFKGETKDSLSSVKTQYGLLSFELLTDEEHFGSRNPVYAILLNNEKIGETGGQGFGMATFSPDKRYYSLRSRAVMGCVGMCQLFVIKVIDLKDKKVFFIEYPQEGFGDPKESDSKFIESYFWKDNVTLTVTTFSVSYSYQEDSSYIVNVTPKQVWNYDVINKQYKLIE